MIIFLKELCGACYDDPKQAFTLAWLAFRVVSLAIIGCIIYGLAELYELINKKRRGR